MTAPLVSVVIPFRDRGIDPRRAANLDIVLAWWWAHDFDPCVVDDGLEGDAQFNRHRAYNRAVAQHPEADVFVFTEADMLIPPQQIEQSVRMAAHSPGLVVPFTQYRYLSDETTAIVRDTYHDFDSAWVARWWSRPTFDPASVFGLDPEYVRGGSLGAINVVSRNTLAITGGFTEATSGNWYDDNITEEGFAFLTGRRTRFVPGPAIHLYHLPGWKGDHLTDEDRRATDKNRRILDAMRGDIRAGNHKEVRHIMKERA